MMKTFQLILVLTAGAALGSIEKRVTGRNTRYCREGEGKHQVMLSLTTLRDPQHQYFSYVICGGTRIRSRWILTAAHCDKSDLTVLEGRQPDTAIMRRIVEKVKYPGHDLMLLKLRRRILSNGKTKAELPDLHCTTPPLREEVDIFGSQDAYINQTGHMSSYNAGTLRCGKMKVQICHSTYYNNQTFCGMAFHVDGNALHSVQDFYFEGRMLRLLGDATRSKFCSLSRAVEQQDLLQEISRFFSSKEINAFLS
ncbi:uncharacterized protein LOC125802545 [Astyanax mexicanus]|uniref:uncharacterized protein LOC125802545 n=1 Tax=Astyanax mexicanus TaxID=7994 RepID=UPI0020CB39DA|nr:uncharacterized protein LOC125802545 [Astyanax mexicanus]